MYLKYHHHEFMIKRNFTFKLMTMISKPLHLSSNNFETSRGKTVVLGSLDTITFFNLLPKKAKLGTEDLVQSYSSLNLHCSYSFILFKLILKVY